MDTCSAWSSPRRQPFSHTPSKCTSYQSSPIPIPRRKIVDPPPCSPIRNQVSPDLAFNLQFSISPDVPHASIDFLQHGATILEQPKRTHVPFSTLATQGYSSRRPFADEPFLYTIPKIPLRDARNTSQNTHTKTFARSKQTVGEGPPGGSLSSVSSAWSLESDRRHHPPHDKSISATGDENLPLTNAFRGPLLSASTTSLSSIEDGTFLVTPPRTSHLSVHSRPALPAFSQPLQRTSTAAPVVSLSIAQAERPDSVWRPHGDSSNSGVIHPRPRRSSSAGAAHDLRRIQTCGRRPTTVVGRGAGRVVSMVESRFDQGKSLVSDEDIECSLEKTDSSVDKWASRGRSRLHGRTYAGGPLEVQRGHARGRALEIGSGRAVSPRVVHG